MGNLPRSLWYGAATVVICAGLWVGGCLQGRAGVLREAAKAEKVAQDSLASLKAQNAALAVSRAVAEAARDSATAVAQGKEVALAQALQAAKKATAATLLARAGLDSAKSAADSLREYPRLVRTLETEVSHLRATVDTSLSLIAAKDVVIAAAARLQAVTDSQRLNAEARVTALGKLNDGLARELAHAKTDLWPKLKVSGGTIAVGVAVLCLGTKVC